MQVYDIIMIALLLGATLLGTLTLSAEPSLRARFLRWCAQGMEARAREGRAEVAREIEGAKKQLAAGDASGAAQRLRQVAVRLGDRGIGWHAERSRALEGLAAAERAWQAIRMPRACVSSTAAATSSSV